jgi:hypothetical protein
MNIKLTITRKVMILVFQLAVFNDSDGKYDDDDDDDNDDDVSKPVVWKYPNSLQVW